MYNAFAHLMLQCSYFHDKRQRTQLPSDLLICLLYLIVAGLPILESFCAAQPCCCSCTDKGFCTAVRQELTELTAHLVNMLTILCDALTISIGSKLCMENGAVKVQTRHCQLTCQLYKQLLPASINATPIAGCSKGSPHTVEGLRGFLIGAGEPAADDAILNQSAATRAAGC